MNASLTWRQRNLSKPILNWYRKVLPPISATERDAIAAGTVWWDADLFSGKPNWAKLRGYPKPQLSADEQAVVANARRDYDRATKLPADFVREKAIQGSRGYHVWARAKAADDFAS